MTWIGRTLILFLLVGATHTAHAQDTSNAGFVQGLWYDRESLIEGKTTRIYVAVRNNTGADLSGTVEFFVNDRQIERRNVDALSNRIIESWADWTPKYGTSTIRATISRTEINSTASGTVAVSVVSALTEDTVFVDIDTDGDEIGNQEDKDDDGDGISDKEERENGTDPLVPEAPEEDENEETDEPENTDESENEEVVEDDGEPDGLEQYLADSRGEDVISSLTDSINSTRNRLDTYRETRNQRIAETRASEKPAPVPDSSAAADESGTSTDESSAKTLRESSFGNIKRVQGEAPQDAKGFFALTWDWLTHNTTNLYTFILWGLSEFLWRPVLVQILLLLLLLYSIYKVAKKLGARKK